MKSLGSLRVLNDDDHRVTSQEKLRDITFFILRSGPLSLALLRHLGPHLQYAL